MLDDFGYDILMESVHHIEHILPITLPTLWIFGREVLLHEWKLHELLVQMLDRKLIIPHNLNKLDLSPFKQLLFSSENFLGKVFCEHLV